MLISSIKPFAGVLWGHVQDQAPRRSLVGQFEEHILWIIILSERGRRWSRAQNSSNVFRIHKQGKRNLSINFYDPIVHGFMEPVHLNLWREGSRGFSFRLLIISIWSNIPFFMTMKWWLEWKCTLGRGSVVERMSHDLELLKITGSGSIRI